ncbi:MAG: hypothetical protein AAGJ52_04745 [Pseudomonadota bacterium]
MSLMSFPALVVSAALSNALPPSPDQVLEIPDDLLAQAQLVVAEPGASRERRLDRLVEFVSETDHLGFSYRGDATHTVGQTFAVREGNCLSFTLLFLSLSRALGLESEAREVSIPPAWQDQGDTLFEVGHINVGVDTPSRRRTVDFDPDYLRSLRLAAPWRGRVVSDERALAHYYNNRAAELSGQGQVALATLWIQQALALDPTFDSAYNTAGVIQRRLGRTEEAQRYFESALELNAESASVLFNLIALAEQTGRSSGAQGYRERLHSLHPDDPWFHWQLGRGYRTQGETVLSLAAFRRAYELDPGQARFARDLMDTLIAANLLTEAVRVRMQLARLSSATSSAGGLQDPMSFKKKPDDWKSSGSNHTTLYQ